MTKPARSDSAQAPQIPDDISDVQAHFHEPPLATDPQLLTSCSGRRCAHGLADCMNLAPAGTGTQTVTDWLKAEGSPWAHHDHWRRANTSAPCLVLTVRDPVARLRSGWRLRLAKSHRFRGPDSGFLRGMLNLSQFVAALRDPQHERHIESLGLYRASLLNPRHEPRQRTRQLGDPFLTPVASYLHGVQLQRVELHLLCTERLGEGITELRASLEHNEMIGASFLRNQRVGQAAHGGAKYLMTLTQRTELNEADAAFLRALYPWDVALHARVCARAGRGAVQRSFSGV